MKFLLPLLAVFCFTLAGVGCKSTCSSCSSGCDHAHKECCGKCGKDKCCGKCGKDTEKKCCGKCGKDKE